MVLDSSALVAVLTQEPGFEELLEAIGTAETVLIAAPTVLEVAIVLSHRWKRDARSPIAAFLKDAEAIIVPFHDEHYEVAVDAFLRYGKGRHPAALNYGDTIAYALATVSGQPLLYVGQDFARTDVASAL